MRKEIIGAERDALILDILKRLEEAKPHADAEAWERGWLDAHVRFLANPCEDSLVPDFIRNLPVRCHSEFCTGVSERDYVKVMQRWLAEQFLDCKSVYEFGCGTGYNLVALARLLPADLCGFDRSLHAVELVRDAGIKLDLPIGADHFDMLKPTPVDIPSDTGVFTFGAMEQVGAFCHFIEWLVFKRPLRVVHVEPIPELLDENNLVDWLSLQFHKKRGYTVGLLPYLQSHPKIEVLQVERSNFGSLMLESYARIVWRPK